MEKTTRQHRPRRSSPKNRDLGLCPFVVVIDQREQAPFSFTGIRERNTPLVIRTQTKHLPTGDYSIAGWESRVTIERKSKEDLYGTLTHGRERFVHEIERMRTFDFSAVVVEASLGDISAAAPPFSNALPKSIYRSILAFSVRYRTQWVFCDSRRLAEITTFRLLERFWLEHEAEFSFEQNFLASKIRT